MVINKKETYSQRESFSSQQRTEMQNRPQSNVSSFSNNNTNKNFLDKQVQITISPRHFLKNSVVILFLIAIFFAGRWSVDPPMLDIELDAEDTSLEAVKELPEEKTEEVITAAATVETAPPDENIKETNTEAPTETTTEPVAEVEETIITSYQRVAFSMDSIQKERKGTWGKMTHLDITIKNNEAGTIKPDHVIMRVKGYDDIEKKMSLPKTSSSIKAGEKTSVSLPIPYGFSYNEATAGDLKKVKVTSTLYDANNKVMSSFESDFNLSG